MKATDWSVAICLSAIPLALYLCWRSIACSSAAPCSAFRPPNCNECKREGEQRNCNVSCVLCVRASFSRPRTWLESVSNVLHVSPVVYRTKIVENALRSDLRKTRGQVEKESAPSPTARTAWLASRRKTQSWVPPYMRSLGNRSRPRGAQRERERWGGEGGRGIPRRACLTALYQRVVNSLGVDHGSPVGRSIYFPLTTKGICDGQSILLSVITELSSFSGFRSV